MITTKEVVTGIGDEIRRASIRPQLGTISSCAACSVESVGPHSFVGELCGIFLDPASEPLTAEVVGFRDGRNILMPYGAVSGVKPGQEVMSYGHEAHVMVSNALLGRVVDGLGHPVDGADPISPATMIPVRSRAPSPMKRSRVQRALETGIRTIDGLLTTGVGQRVGIFAGSGVGKSTLLGMIANNVSADVNVVALIGERGRELRDFIDNYISDRRGDTVVVIAAADEPAIIRVQAAWTAVAISEYFRDQGKDVALYVDSLTRLAMAQREIGLAAAEPPTSRGYTPSVFALMPQLVERVGPGLEGGGSITGFFTVLVEGDDMNDPIADHARSILDGHIVLLRKHAQSGRYPAIDPLQSVSRVMPSVTTENHLGLAKQMISVVSDYEESKDLVEFGAYHAGSNEKIDRALELMPSILDFLTQNAKTASTLDETVTQMKKVIEGGVR